MGGSPWGPISLIDIPYRYRGDPSYRDGVSYRVLGGPTGFGAIPRGPIALPSVPLGFKDEISYSSGGPSGSGSAL